MEKNQLYNFEYKPTKHIINIMKKALIGLLVAGAAIAANAQDKALLETLVKKGMLTQQEAAQIAKESVTVSPSTASTKSIKIFGGAQGWYTWAQDTVKAGNSGSRYRLRHRRRIPQLSRQGRSLQEDRRRLHQRHVAARPSQGQYGL